MPPYQLEALDKEKHDRKRFACGYDELDSYLRNTARQASDTGTATCWVATDPDDPSRIAGYFTLTQHAIDPGPENRALFEKYPKVPRSLAVPATLLGRLAVDQDYQGLGIGPDLLAAALERALAVSSVVASRAVVVDPIDDKARSFYEAHGFELLNGETGRLFMPMHWIAAHFEPTVIGATEGPGGESAGDE